MTGLSSLSAASAASSSQIEAIFVNPVRSAAVGNAHGDVFLKLGDGSVVQRSYSHLASDARLVRNARGSATYGWVEGQYLSYRDLEATPPGDPPPVLRATYFPKQIVIYREGRRIAAIAPHKLFAVRWTFLRGGSLVGVGSVGSHGQTYYQLFRADGGRALGMWTNNSRHKPAWTRFVEL